jgi:hypothetical protein
MTEHDLEPSGHRRAPGADAGDDADVPSDPLLDWREADEEPRPPIEQTDEAERESE